MPLIRFIIVVYLTAFLSGLATADNAVCDDEPSQCQKVGAWDLSVSIGLGARTNPLVGGDEQPILLVPQFSWYGENFFLDNFDIGYTFIDQPQHMLNALAGLSFDHIYFDEIGLGNITLNTGAGFSEGGALNSAGDRDPEFNDGLNPSEDRRDIVVDVDDLSQRKIAVLAGLDYSYFSGSLQTNIQLLNDISAVHDGQELRLSSAYSYQNNNNRSLTTFALGLAWQSENLLDYYYGVDAGELSANSPAFEVESGVSTFAKLTYEKKLTEKWTFLGTLQFRKLPSSLESSPIVEKTGVATFFIGGSYHF